MTKRLATSLSRAFFVAALALLVAGVAVDSGPRPMPVSGDELVVENPRISFGTAPGGETFEVGIVLANRSSRPIRLLGSDVSCTMEGCLRIEGLPWAIPPHSQRGLKIQVKTRAPGVFRAQLTVFTDCDSERRLQLGVDGIVLASS